MSNPETSPRFAGIGGHHSHKSGTVEWLTPPDIIEALGGWQSFDLDPCAPMQQPTPTARRTYTKAHNGLILPWEGRTWLNPPYANGEIEQWLARMAEHGLGTALIFARTETDAFFRFVWYRATALLFMRGRVTFQVGAPYTDTKTGRHYALGDRAPGNAGAPTVLCAYGIDDADVLATCKIDGAFVPLRIPRSVVVSLFAASNEEAKISATWSQALAEFFAGSRGPVLLDDLYAAFRTHPKAEANPNYQAKLRQQLQCGPYRRVQPGLWEQAT